MSGCLTFQGIFDGSKSYYASYARIDFVVDDAPEPRPSLTPAPALISEVYFGPAIAGIIVAIAIVGALLTLLLLKKRP